MFILATKPAVLWPVVYRTAKDGGGFDEHTFQGRFNLPVDQAEVDALYSRADAERERMLNRMLQKPGAEGPDNEIGGLDAHIIDTYFTGWPDGEVKDAQGGTILYTPESRQLLLAMPGMRVAVARAFMQTLNGGAAETKNSKPL